MAELTRRQRVLGSRTGTCGSGSSSAQFFLGLLTFVYVPIVWSVWLNFYDTRNTVTPTTFVGFGNYADMLADPAFRSSMLTFLVFLSRQYFLGFRREIEDAARIDGLGYFGTFWRVVLPNSLGFVAAIGTLTFIGSWNAFLWPLVIGQDQNTWTVKIALSTFLTQQTSNQHQLFVRRRDLDPAATGNARPAPAVDRPGCRAQRDQRVACPFSRSASL